MNESEPIREAYWCRVTRLSAHTAELEFSADCL